MRITANDELTLYIDGILYDQRPKHNIFDEEDIVEIPATFQVIAVKVVNGDDKRTGILASLENANGDIIMRSDVNTWNCSPTLESGWQSVDFNDHSNWPSAVPNGSKRKVGTISNSATWIYSVDDPNDEFYCRYSVALKRQPIVGE